MAGYASRVRGRQLRAYGILAVAVILVFFLIAIVTGAFSGKDSSGKATATPKLNTTPTQIPTDTLGSETPDPGEATPTADPGDGTPDPNDPTPTPGQATGDYKVIKLQGSGSTLNLRSEPSTSSNRVESLSNYTVVELLEAGLSDGWCKVKTYDDKEGYVKESYLAAISVSVNQGLKIETTMNVRSQPSTSASVVVKLDKAKTVRIVQFNVNGSWCKVVAEGGKVGYMMQQYLADGIGDLPTVNPTSAIQTEVASTKTPGATATPKPTTTPAATSTETQAPIEAPTTEQQEP